MTKAKPITNRRNTAHDVTTGPTVTAKLSVAGDDFAVVVAFPKTFKSGKVGWWGQARLDEFAGKRYMAQVQLVEIGS